MKRELIDNYTIELSQSEISSIMENNTIIEGAELRKNQILQSYEFKELDIRQESPRIATEQIVDNKIQIIQGIQDNFVFKQNLSEKSIQGNPCVLKKEKVSSWQNGSLNYSPQSRKSKVGQEQHLDSSNKSIFKPSTGRQKRCSIMKSGQGNSNSPHMINSGQKSNFKNIKSISSIQKFQQILTLKSNIQKIMRYVPSAKLQKFTSFHYNIIGDKALLIKENRKFIGVMKYLPTIKPNQILFDIWKIFQLLLVGMHLFRVLLLFGFPKENLDLEQGMKVISISFFIIDFFLNLNAGYYQGMTIVTDRISILKKNSTEIISSGLSIIAMVYSTNPFLNLVFIARLRALFSNISLIEQNFSLDQKYPVLLTISKLLLFIILIAHAFACGFVFITQFEEDFSMYWIKKQGLIGECWERIYLNSLYFSFITMITVGYGDIAPITDYERIYVIFFTLITCIVYAYVVNTIGSLFAEFAQKSAKFKKQRFQILSYLNDRKISKPLEISVMKYLEFTQHQEKELKYSKVGEQFLSSIPSNLHKEVCEDFYGKILNGVSILNKHFSKKCLSVLSQTMKELTLGPDELIFSQGDFDFKFFFIMSGKVELILDLNDSQSTSRSLGFLLKGQSFGEKSLFQENQQKLTAKCLTNTSIVYLKKNEFINILKEFRNDYEKYCMIRDQSSQDMASLNLKCLSCQNRDHEITDCDLLLLKPRKAFIICKHNHNLKQDRSQSFIRKQSKSSHSLKFNIPVRGQLKKLRVSLLNKEFNNIIGKIIKQNEFIFEYIFENNPELDEKFFEVVPEFYYKNNEIVMEIQEEVLNYESQSQGECQSDSLNQELNQALEDYWSTSQKNYNKFKTKELKYQNSQEGLAEKLQQSDQIFQDENLASKFISSFISFEPKLETFESLKNIPNQQFPMNNQANYLSNQTHEISSCNSSSQKLILSRKNSIIQNDHNNSPINPIKLGFNFSILNLDKNVIQGNLSSPQQKGHCKGNSSLFSPQGDNYSAWIHSESTVPNSNIPSQQFKGILKGQKNQGDQKQNKGYQNVKISPSKTQSQFFAFPIYKQLSSSCGCINDDPQIGNNQQKKYLQDQNNKQFQDNTQDSDKQGTPPSFFNQSDLNEKDTSFNRDYYPRKERNPRLSKYFNKKSKISSGIESSQSQNSPQNRKQKRKVTIFKDQMKMSFKSNYDKYNSSNFHELPLKIKNELEPFDAKLNSNFLQEDFHQNKIFILMQFDQLKDYQYYFPSFNYSALKFKNKGESIVSYMSKKL